MINPILILGAVTYLTFTPSVVKYDSNQEHIIINQYDVELTAWEERLGKCESGNNPLAINKYDGGSSSNGYHQYKFNTWNGDIKKYNLPFTEEDIWLKEAQMEVTKTVIKNEPKGYLRWTNCTTNPSTPNYAGLPPLKAQI